MGSLTPRYAYIALGSNMGDRQHALTLAQERLAAHPWLAITRRSSIYETQPIGYTDQPSFLNMVIEVLTCCTPYSLLMYMLAVENSMGRKRLVRWGPRVIDLDLLLYENETACSRELQLPHPRMHERAFVLVPLLEVWRPERFGPPPSLPADLRDQGVTLWAARGEDARE